MGHYRYSGKTRTLFRENALSFGCINVNGALAVVIQYELLSTSYST